MKLIFLVTSTVQAIIHVVGSHLNSDWFENSFIMEYRSRTIYEPVGIELTFYGMLSLIQLNDHMYVHCAFLS